MWICTAFSFLASMIYSLRVEFNCIEILGFDDSVTSFFTLNARYVVKAWQFFCIKIDLEATRLELSIEIKKLFFEQAGSLKK